MSATITKVVKKAGANYAVTNTGAEDVVLKYQVVFSAPVDCATELPTSFTDGTTTIPAIGTEHTARRGYYAAKYEISQPDGAAKNTLNVTVRYSAELFETTGEGQAAQSAKVEQWGWSDGTANVELVEDADGKQVLNSAGDTFQTVPTRQTPAPTFQKVVNFKARQSGWFASNCTVNAASVTIGGISFDAHTLLCTVVETYNIGNEEWPYKYSISLKFRTNKATVAGGSSATECGWDAVVLDAGLREKDSTTGQLKAIQVTSTETGEAVNIQSPELLDGQGRAVARSASGTPPTPYNIRFKPYTESTWPSWFYSEPTASDNQQGGNS